MNTETTTTNFEQFLESYEDWAIRIEAAPGVFVFAFDTVMLSRLIAERERGIFSVMLRADGETLGSAVLTKLITGKLKEDLATRSCVGIAGYYNGSLWSLWKQERSNV